MGMTRTRHTLVPALLAAAAAALLAGCGEQASTTTTAASPTTDVPSASSPAAASSPALISLTAEQVVAALAGRIATVTPTVVFTEETDPNKDLGRPGKYASKASFTDTRIKTAEIIDNKAGSVDLGGGVEVYPAGDAAGAKARAEYIQTVSKGMQILDGEYDYVAGNVLLRVTANLTPKQAAEFAGPLAAITGTQVEGPIQAK